MTRWTRRSLQAMQVGTVFAAVAALWVVVLAFMDPQAIDGWPLVLLGFGAALVLGGVVGAELHTRRQARPSRSDTP